jgi:hypothetical protein
MGIMRYDKSTDVTSGSINVVYPASGILELSWLVPRSVRPVAFSRDGKQHQLRLRVHCRMKSTRRTGAAQCRGRVHCARRSARTEVEGTDTTVQTHVNHILAS